jgi:hypothetical protein
MKEIIVLAALAFALVAGNTAFLIVHPAPPVAQTAGA